MNATTETPSVYDPAPGEEYTYPLSDYARAAARALGPAWGAESGYLGAEGLIYTRDGRHSLRLYVDEWEDLTFETKNVPGVLCETHAILGEALPEIAPRTPDELTEWGEAIAAAIREALSI